MSHSVNATFRVWCRLSEENKASSTSLQRDTVIAARIQGTDAIRCANTVIKRSTVEISRGFISNKTQRDSDRESLFTPTTVDDSR